jgi:hypothetical protein
MVTFAGRRSRHQGCNGCNREVPHVCGTQYEVSDDVRLNAVKLYTRVRTQQRHCFSQRMGTRTTTGEYGLTCVSHWKAR